jgi:prepilin peptidase CpaA
VTRYIIPNWLVGMMLLYYVFAVFTAEDQVLDWKMALVGACIVLAVGYVVFMLRMMGAGDIKLISACALWVGYNNLPDFLITVGMCGGLLAVIIWCLRKALPFMLSPAKVSSLPRILCDREDVPYGVAIAFGFLMMMWGREVPAIG